MAGGFEPAGGISAGSTFTPLFKKADSMVPDVGATPKR
jgi:hypothetical protein